jgi:hypothetical protein
MDQKVFLFALLTVTLVLSEDVKKKTDLEVAESQSFGYGYGTKVADGNSVATGKRLSMDLKGL